VAENAGELVACGGWSWRKTLFGGDAQPDREPEVSSDRLERDRVLAQQLRDQ
jgi:hypothetical protein